MTEEQLLLRIKYIKVCLKNKDPKSDEAYFLRRKRRRLELLFEDLYLDTFDKDDDI